MEFAKNTFYGIPFALPPPLTLAVTLEASPASDTLCTDCVLSPGLTIGAALGAGFGGVLSADVDVA